MGYACNNYIYEVVSCDEILLDDVHALHTNEAYTTFLLATRGWPHS